MIARAARIVLVAAVTTGCDGELRFDEPAPSADAGAAHPSGCHDAPCGALGLVCDDAGGRCVACLSDDDCHAPGRARCELAGHVCVACLEAADCGPRAACEPTTHRCVETCAEGDEACAAPGFVCDERAGRCIECRIQAHCAAAPGGPRCDGAVGACVECAGNASCPPSAPVCDRRTGRCVSCVTSDACAEGSACDPETMTCRPVP